MKIVKRAIAGAVAGFVLKQVNARINAKQHKGKSVAQGEREAVGPELRLVERVIDRLPVSLSDRQHEVVASVMRYGLGMLITSLLTRLRHRVTEGRSSLVGGALFGMISYGLMDVVLYPLLGVADSAAKLPLSDHLRSGVSHAIYGATDNAMRRLLAA